VKFKHSVVHAGVQAPCWYALGVIEVCYRHRGFEVVVTSLADSHENRPASLHNQGLACDIRIRNIPASTLAFIVSDIKEILEPVGYDIVLENNHIHCEYQPKNGENLIEETD